MWSAIVSAQHSDPWYRVACPLLLIAGERDRIVHLDAEYRRWANRDIGALRRTIRGAGHNANQERPAEFNVILLSFLADCPRRKCGPRQALDSGV